MSCLSVQTAGQLLSLELLDPYIIGMTIGSYFIAALYYKMKSIDTFIYLSSMFDSLYSIEVYKEG